LKDSVLLSAQRLSGGFLTSAGRLEVISEVSLEIRANKVLGVVGPNGCGKSTLLRLLCGLIKPFRGEVLRGDGSGRPGMVFQQVTQNLVPWLTVYENVAIACKLRVMKIQEAHKSSADAIEKLGLESLRSRYPAELSGGQQQLTALARWAAVRPSLLLYDEGWSMLDLVQRSRARTILRELATLGSGVVIVSHDLMELARCADEVVALSGTPASVRARIHLDGEIDDEGRLHKLWTEAFRAFNALHTA